MREAGFVDQYLEAAKLLDNLSDHVAHRVATGYVALQGQRHMSSMCQFAGDLLRGVKGNIHADHKRASAAKRRAMASP